MVEAHKGPDAGEVEGSRVVGGAGCLGCDGHGLGRLMQEHDRDVPPSGTGSQEALARVRQEC
jgi:hypothetical protein